MASHRLSSLILGLSMALLLISPSESLTCLSQRFSNNKHYNHCTDLPQLSSYLHWSYDSKTSSLSIAFVAALPPETPNGWISWALNPTGPRMPGAQSLIAFKDSKGSMTVNTYNISAYDSIVKGKIAFDVKEMSADYSDGMMRIFATVTVPAKTVNHVWQVGPSVTKGFPEIHATDTAHMSSMGTLDLLKGEADSGRDSSAVRKNIHGILNAVSWGILFPLGIVIARYLRTFQSADPAWFYLHVFCQVSAYAIGVAGWATGLKLGSESKGIQYTGHRNIGIALFCLATIQGFALLLRPKKDHKYRLYWNIYHHGVGYAVLILGVINVFKGIDMLHPEKKWRSVYIVVITGLGIIALLMEAITWVVVLRRKSRISTKHYDGYNNGQGRELPLAS